eukprot:CAMPEP_0172640402 /NCGR_PEP_ID=MMETSP1068-20121228/222946_1 /TAXON_ID=35684 /ORGANISM="Pseudopedinella elastica, Strain CCMP716" /LENGTH=167 /DNA_ID=CAMNT_0013453775 /DNA_START=248 /DNA_END=751 /DNA_ORIENTATION=-
MPAIDVDIDEIKFKAVVVVEVDLNVRNSVSFYFDSDPLIDLDLDAELGMFHLPIPIEEFVENLMTEQAKQITKNKPWRINVDGEIGNETNGSNESNKAPEASNTERKTISDGDDIRRKLMQLKTEGKNGKQVSKFSEEDIDLVVQALTEAPAKVSEVVFEDDGSADY